MLPLFAFPWAFLAVLAVPVLAGIYWFRSKYRKHTVSSLMLWMSQRESREGGTKVERLQLPLLFFLELLAILLCMLAAVGPKFHAAKDARPLVVVLDDSYSMLAGGSDSPRTRAVAAIDQELRRGLGYSVRFLLAGPIPQFLGEAVRSFSEAQVLLKDWKCLSPSADLDKAIALAAEVGGKRALILVVTDHKPPAGLEEGRVEWRAFGKSQPNLAFVNGARSARDDRDRCLLEIANLSAEPQTAALTITKGSGEVYRQESLTLSGQEVRRIIFDVREGTPILRGKLGDDSLAIDNQVVLMPETLRHVRVDVRVKDGPLQALVEKAVAAIPSAALVTTRPELVITDQDQGRTAGSESWSLQLMAEKEADPYVGPFVMDRAHPLTEGVSLQGVVWGAGKTDQIAGRPVITAGNIPLLTDVESLTGRHELRLRLRTDLSTLQDAPDWPILIWNLIQWRGAQAPGLTRSNLRLGSETLLTVPADVKTVRIQSPDGTTRESPVLGKKVGIKAEDLGVYEIQAGAAKYAFASNALFRNESDLMEATSGEWGDWRDDPSVQMEYQNIAWLLLLIAVGMLTLHAAFMARGRRASSTRE